jgi:hypothetical protein
VCVQVPKHIEVYLQLFSQARSVAEIGFNCGHSMLTMLTANPAMEVQSFNLGEHDYGRPALEILRKMFATTGARLDVEWGSSLETVPAFHAQEV